jgi:hypothetical protein
MVAHVFTAPGYQPAITNDQGGWLWLAGLKRALGILEITGVGLDTINQETVNAFRSLG